MTQTIAQRLKVTEFPFVIKDKRGNVLYEETRRNKWERNEYDEKNRIVYHEEYHEVSSGFWMKKTYDRFGNVSRMDNSRNEWETHVYNHNNQLIKFNRHDGYWAVWEYNDQGQEVSYKNSNNHWEKWEYDANGHEIYYACSNGELRDNRPKVELTLEEIATKFGVDVNQLKIKK
jgi:hypothetical protein